MDWQAESEKLRHEAGYDDYQPLEPFVSRRSVDRSLWYEGQLLVIYAQGPSVNNTCCFWEGNIPDGMGPPPHMHVYEHEMFFILEGHVRAWVEGVEHDVPKDSLIFLPAGRIHWFQSVAPVTRVLSVTVTADKRFPAVNEGALNVFRYLGQPAESLDLPPGEWPDFQPDIGKMKELMDPYGFRLVDLQKAAGWNRAYGDPNQHRHDDGDA